MSAIDRLVKARLKDEVVTRSRRLPVRKGHVLYEANSGHGAVCSPEAIFRALLAAPDMGHLTHVWALADVGEAVPVVAEFAGDRRVRFVKVNSPGYFAALATARYLVNNATFPPELAKRPGQIYVNTWHGTPLKKMGYDVEGGGPATRNIIRNFLQADFILSPNPFTTEEMLRRAYRLDGIFPGAIVEEGYPRVDRQFLDDAGRAAVRARLAAAGVALEAGQRVLLWAPTWKGASFYSPLDDVAELAADVARLQAELAGTPWRVLLKIHPRVLRYARTVPGLAGVLVPDEIPANVVLGVTDALVTDYSSIFYDFQATGRPTLFLIPDIDLYAGYRGLYVKPADWPGPVAATVGDLARLVRAVGTGAPEDPCVSHAAALAESRRRYNPYDDGRAAERVIDVVFRGREDGRRVHRDFDTGRTSLLIFAGAMLNNGITTSLLNLLDALDHDRVDVSLTYAVTPETTAMADLVNPAIRLLPQVGEFRAPRSAGRVLKASRFPWGDDPLTPSATKAFADEWRRCYGAARFDHVVDFSGYSPAWAGVLAQAPAWSRSIWQHNELAAEVGKEVDGKRPHALTLPQVFALYSRYDHVVSVSRALSEVNEAKLGSHAPGARFTYAHNIVDADRIRRLAATSTVHPRGDAPAGWGPDLAADVAALAGRYDLDAVAAEVGRQALVRRYVGADPGVRTFVTMGRLSPEKNQARLLAAFREVHADDPATRLVLIGTGQLHESLQLLASSLGIAEAVRFTGQLANPFPLLAASGCFVLSSDYEGQPMVLLEALVLGLSVVSTRFDSVADALGPGQGLVVDRSVAGLAEGMRAYLRGEVPPASFDPEAYNRRALAEFFAAIGAPV